MAMRSKTGDLIIPTPKKSRQDVDNIRNMPQRLVTKLVNVIVVKVKGE